MSDWGTFPGVFTARSVREIELDAEQALTYICEMNPTVLKDQPLLAHYTHLVGELCRTGKAATLAMANTPQTRLYSLSGFIFCI